MSPTTEVPEKQWVLPHSSTQTHRQLQWSQDSSYFQVVLIKLGSELNHYSLCLGMRWHVAALAASGYPGASEGTCSWVTAQSSGTELCAATGAGALLESEIAWGRRSCLQVCHGELTPKSTLLKAATAEDPGQQSRFPRSLGEEDGRLSSHVNTHLTLEEQQVESVAIFQGKEVAQTHLWWGGVGYHPWDWWNHLIAQL